MLASRFTYTHLPNTYSINVASSRLIQLGAIATDSGIGKVVQDVAVESAGLSVVKLVAVSVRLSRTSTVARLRAAGNNQLTAASTLENNGIVNGASQDSLQRGAVRVVLVAAVTSGGNANTVGTELGSGVGVRHGSTAGGGETENCGEGEELIRRDSVLVYLAVHVGGMISRSRLPSYLILYLQRRLTKI